MFHQFRLAIVSLAFLLTAPFLTNLSAQAGISLRPGIIGKDDRKLVDNSKPPWSAIGQINVAGYRVRASCTGTLIAPRLVLTAAHCVMDILRKRPFEPERIHFAAGVFRERVLGRAMVACVRFPPGYHYVGPGRVNADLPQQRVPMTAFRLDLALMVLRKDIPRAGTFPLLTSDALRGGLSLMHASYAMDRRYVLTADSTCKALWRIGDVWLTDCDTFGASSGGPIVVTAGGKPKIAAVMVGMLENGGGTLAVPLSQWPDMPLKAECP